MSVHGYFLRFPSGMGTPLSTGIIFFFSSWFHFPRTRLRKSILSHLALPTAVNDITKTHGLDVPLPQKGPDVRMGGAWRYAERQFDVPARDGAFLAKQPNFLS